MPILVNCPICGIRLSLADDRGGTTMDCPKCDAKMMIPGTPPPPPPMRPALQTVHPVSPPPFEDLEEDEEPIRKRRKVRRRDDDFDDDDRPSRRGSRRGFECPFCGSHRSPIVSTQISPTGWIVFALLLIFTVCLCFIGLFITEETRRCRDCGMKLG